MFAVYGVLTLAVFALLMRAFIILFRSPTGPKWIKANSSLASTIGVVFAGGLVAGVAMLGQFAATYSQQTFGVVEGVALVAVIAGYFALSMLLKRYSGRVGAAEAAAGQGGPQAANQEAGKGKSERAA